MGDLQQRIFGGSKANSQQTSESGPVDVTPEEYRKMRGPFADQIMKMFSGGGMYQGPLSANLRQPEQDVLDQLKNSGMGRQAYLEKTIGGGFLPGQPGSNPFLDSAIKAAQRPTFEGLTETLDKALPGRFTQAGQFTNPHGTSAFDNAAALAARSASNTAGDIATNMSFGGYESERNRQQAAVSLSQQDVGTMIQNLQAQGLPRLIEDMGIQRGIEVFKQHIASILEALKTVGGLTSQFAQFSKSQGTSDQTKYDSPFHQIFPRGA